MCGIIGLVGHPDSQVGSALYDGLLVLQHRGQDAAGIVTSDSSNISHRRANGPARCEKLLRDAAAVGADNLVHVSVENINDLDSTQVQNLLAAAVQKSGASVIFCGKQAADTNAGSTGPGVAELIGASCVTLVSEVSSDGGEYTATRPSSAGHEKVAVSAPCVFAFDKGVTEMRRPNVRGIMMAKKKPIETWSVDELGVDIGATGVSVDSHSPPAEKPPGQKFEGAESVSTVVSKLRDEANVI